MRIKQLTLHNIASIADASIDFCGEELSGASVILISGETGAGKTTILDAICLALYASTPRMTSTAHEELSAAVDSSIKFYANDNAQLLRRGTGEGYVVLTFEGNDGEDYEATWAVQRDHKKPYKKLQKPTRSLRCISSSSYFETHKKRIEEKIQEITGLDYEQFCRTVMLAQGEFTKFLKSKRSEKSQILEKLTGTEIYSEIGKKIAEKFLRIRNEWEVLKKEVDKFIVLSDHEIETYKSFLQTKFIEIEEIKKHGVSLKEKFRWLENYNNLILRKNRKSYSLLEIETLIKDPLFIQDKELVKDFFLTVIPRKLQNDIKKGKIDIESQEAFGIKLKEKIKDIIFKTEEKEKELKEIEAEITAKEKDIEKLNIEAINLKIRDLHEKKVKLSEFIAILNELNSIEKQLSELGNEKEELQNKIEEYYTLQSTAENGLKEAENRKEEADKNYERLFLSTSDAAKRLRSVIRKGDACPVCGEIIMKELDNEMFETIITPFRIQKQEADVFYREKKALALSFNKIIAELTVNRSNLEKKYHIVEKNFCQRKEQIIDFCGVFEMRNDDLSKLNDEIIGKVDFINKELISLNQFQQKYIKQSEELKQLRSKNKVERRTTEQVREELHKTIETYAKWEAALKEKRIKVEEDLHALNNFLLEHPEVDIKRVEELQAINEHHINTLKERIEQTEALLQKERGVLESIHQEIATAEQTKPELEEDDNLDNLKEKQAENEKEIEELNIRIGEVTERLKVNEMNLLKLGNLKKDEERKREEKEKWELLYKFLGDTDGAKFRGVAQSLILKSLLDNANVYMETFTDRYYLTCNPGSLTILVKDRLRPSDPQPASILSGGESFMASLSLALALSNLKGGGMNVDIIFIDEGFGTLSTEYLGNVMESLEKLHQMGGRKVGLISHVPELKERIPVQINVYRESPTLSKVKIESL